MAVDKFTKFAKKSAPKEVEPEGEMDSEAEDAAETDAEQGSEEDAAYSSAAVGPTPPLPDPSASDIKFNDSLARLVKSLIMQHNNCK